ncbi:hypothetical protein EB796_020999 [Bugula neritina]|uniref:Uncharacterized protein n=1 Tax=Bugula neritina TaxID=10212 RepID=A0A7J7J4U5_BUGNE|nr:hypothetical protein EB796_020999 [Bugula neritina]
MVIIDSILYLLQLEQLYQYTKSNIRSIHKGGLSTSLAAIMDSTCSEVGGPRRGFHTFVMTGDAIIRTNYNTNPFKPTRQLPLGSDQPPVQREHCLQSLLLQPKR